MKYIAGIAVLLLIVGATNLTQKKILAKKYDYMPMPSTEGKMLRQIDTNSKFTPEELKMEIESALPVDNKIADDSLKTKATK